ncbi:PAS domain-containing protein [Flavobacterium sp. 270]|uniref:PAS domain-containing protein n=1 Tax=Flavobacterium sp. 270 TaxID=2512114 RepID=UPI001064B57E|nr:PAS domain-containing protein [Flavobacterium sp. 270]
MSDPNLNFLRGGGEMGELTRNYNWSSTSIGAPHQWPQSLRTIVSTILNSKFPMFLWWGKELIQFYNDAYRPSLGNQGKHPEALGGNGSDTWPEIWPVVYPLIQHVLDGGESTWMENQLIPIYRNGSLENVYWTFSYSPVFDDLGAIGGVLVTCTETTDAVVRLKQLDKANAELKASMEHNEKMHKDQIENDLKFKNVANTSPTGLWLSDESGALTYLNNTLVEWTGMPYEALLGHGWAEAIIEEDRENAAAAFMKAVSSRRHYDVVFRLRKFDHSIIQCHAVGDPFYKPDGSYGGYAGFCMDIQNIIEGQKQILESERRFLNLTRQATVGIIVLTGADLKVAIVNDAYANLVGIRQNELLESNLFDVIPEAEQVYRPIIENVRNTGEAIYLYSRPYSVSHKGIKKEGYLNLIYQPYKETDGTVIGVMVTCQDVTAQVIAQQQIEESERLLRTLIEKTPVATALFEGRDLVIRVANDVMLGYLKKDRDILGQSYRKSVPELEGQGYFEILDRIFENGEEYRADGSRADIEKDGKTTTHYFNYSYTPLFNDTGEVYAVLNMAYDVTESTMAQMELEQSRQKLLRSFENSPVGIAIISGDKLVFDMANSFYASLVDRSVEDLSGMPLLEVIPELVGQGFDMQLKKVMDTGETFTAKEVPVAIVRGGRTDILYLDYSYQAQRDSDDQSNSVLAVVIDVTQQVLARKTIESNEKRFRSLIEEAPVGTCLYVGPDMRIDIANKIIMDYWGRGPEVMGKNMLEVFPEMIGQPFPELLKQVYSTGKLHEQKGARADLMIHGVLTTLYFDFTYKPLFDDDGNVYAVLDVAVDVTHQVKASRLLKENQEFIRKIFYKSPVAKMVYIGKEMIVREANEKMFEIFGRGDDILGRPILESIPELRKTDLFERYSRVLESGETFEAFAQRIELIKEGVSYVGYYDYTYKPLFDDNKNPYGVICITIDVTDQVFARLKQQEAEASLRGAVELAQLGTWSIDAATGGLAYSDRLIEWFGYDPSNYDYGNVIPILADEDRQRVADAVAWSMKAESGGIYDEIYTVIHPETGKKRILHAQGKTIFDPEGNPLRMNGTAQDVTLHIEAQLALEQEVRTRTQELARVVEDLQDSNVQLLHSNEELAQFAYIASHDLQEPLRKISTFSQLLENTLPSESAESVRSYLAKIMQSSVRMRTLINDVLNYSKLSTADEKFEHVNLNEIIDYLILDYDLLLEEKNGKITVGELPTLDANPIEMTQLFRNLISNALKFSQEGVDPQIIIRAVAAKESDLDYFPPGKSIGDLYKIEIEDNGIGFEEEYFQRIFNIFLRLHPKTSYEGTGIGLAMCKKIVQNHGGEIFAYAKLGKGAVFSIILPKITRLPRK